MTGIGSLRMPPPMGGLARFQTPRHARLDVVAPLALSPRLQGLCGMAIGGAAIVIAVAVAVYEGELRQVRSGQRWWAARRRLSQTSKFHIGRLALVGGAVCLAGAARAILG